MKASIRSITAVTMSSLLLLTGCGWLRSKPSADETRPIQPGISDRPNDAVSFGDAVNKATEAAELAQTVQTDEDWKMLASTWQQAIDLMNAVPASDAHYETAQQKVAEYQRNLEYAQSNSLTPVNVVRVSEAPPTDPAVPIAQKASQLQMGMSYREVVELLGRMPSTVHNDEILRDLGEPVYGHNLTTFEWKNDDPACHPVSVQFNSSGMTTGWSEGKSCPGPSIFNEPLGKDCAETTLCKLG